MYTSQHVSLTRNVARKRKKVLIYGCTPTGTQRWSSDITAAEIAYLSFPLCLHAVVTIAFK